MGSSSKFALALLVSSACLTAPSLVLAQAAPPPAPAPAASDQGEITVTATRQATNIQKTAVQVSAFTAQKLQDAAANQLSDVTYLTPSVRFSSNSSSAVSYIAIRGISIPPVGSAGQGTQVYNQEVPLAGPALNMPTYDIKNVQVLQGPQGTLFGRNTLAGAILIDPELPSFSQNGYLKAGYGNYNAWTLEGAGNATIIPDVLAVRVAGQIQRRDGIYKSLNPTVLPNQDNLATEAFRASLLFTPTARFRDVLTFDYYHENDTGVPDQPVDPINGPLSVNGLLTGPFGFALGTHQAGAIATPTEQATAALFAGYSSYAAAIAGEQALAACNHRCVYYGNIGANAIFVRQDNYRVFNTTTFDINPNLSLKNIFGFQAADLALGENSGGTGVPLLVPQQFTPARSLTEEVQLRGTAWDGRVHGTLGFYYEHDWDDSNSPSGIITGTGPSPSAVDSKSTAVYANVNVAITEKLKFNGGFRYTWDTQNDCALGGLAIGAPLPTAGQCVTQATTSTVLGNGIIKESNSAPTWSVGLDYQAAPNAFFYIVSRRGYRSGGVNTPLYNSPCLTGAASTTAGGVCPDFGLAATGGVTASGKSIDLSGLQIQQPETLTDVEVGARTDWNLGGWHERLNLTYFHYWYNNVLSQVNFEAPSVPFFGFPIGNPLYPAIQPGDPAAPTFGAGSANVGNIVADGFNAELMVQPTRDLSIDANVSYLHQAAQEKIPAALLAQIPGGAANSAITTAAIQQFTSPTSPWSFNIAGRYMLPWRPLNGELVVNYDYFWTSSWHAQNTLLPGYDLHNVRVDWNNIGNSNISAGLWVRNLLDKTYINAIGAAPFGSVVYGEPRTIGADVTFKFR